LRASALPDEKLSGPGSAWDRFRKKMDALEKLIRAEISDTA